MKNEHYIPSTTEFHVGFEYQIMNIENAQWGTYTFKDTDKIPVDDLDNEFIRVKYLDDEDIQSIGWKKIEPIEEFRSTYEKQVDNPHGEPEKMHLIHVPSSEWVLIAQGNDETMYTDWDTRFSGRIKNKSALINLLKMLNDER